MLKITVNSINFYFNKLLLNNITLLNFSKTLGFKIPHFCYNENLPIAGNCRACLIEVQNLEKPVASCVTELEPNLIFWTKNLFSIKARENIFEMLLINHPLDCPICDQAGECDLQDQSKIFGGASTKFLYKKRSVVDKKNSFFIKTIMTRCIHCTRCVRFNALIGNPSFGILNRGANSEIGSYSLQKIESELIGNVIDLCPVGALTARVYSFQTRPWELKIIESLDLSDGLGANIYLHYKDTELLRITPKPNKYINGNLISDNCRFSTKYFNTNRLKKIYELKDNKYVSLSWFSFLNKVSSFSPNNLLTFSNNKVAILINENLDFFTLLFLKKLSNKYCKQIKINLLNKSTINNLYLSNIFSSLKQIESSSNNCWLLSSNLKLECSILNFKLKLKYQKKIFSIFCLGRFFFTFSNTMFICLNLNNIILWGESKLKKFSFFFTSSIFPLIIIGESFLKRFLNLNFFFFFFSQKYPTTKILKINTFCNEESLSFLNLYGFWKKCTKITYFCINLDTNIYVKKYLFFKTKNDIWWFANNRPVLEFNANYLIPISTAFEFETIFINLEQKAQKSQSFLLSNLNSRPLHDILNSIFCKKSFIIRSNYFNIFKEILLNYKLFNLFKNKILRLFYYNFFFYNKISNYPFKSYLIVKNSNLTETNSFTRFQPSFNLKTE